jgi:hypothetical protein
LQKKLTRCLLGNQTRNTERAQRSRDAHDFSQSVHATSSRLVFQCTQLPSYRTAYSSKLTVKLARPVFQRPILYRRT